MRSPDFQKTGDSLLAESGERQQAEEALRASEQRLQDILDNTTAVVFVKDLELRYILNLVQSKDVVVRQGSLQGD
jgi:PAS domain-containing protein